MTHITSDQKALRPGRRLLFAGVAVAALMGVGLGLWARPAMSERKMSLAAAETPRSAAKRILQIVIDDAPAPLGAPIEVLPATAASVRPSFAPETGAPEPLAPVRPPAGLVRVQTVEAEPVAVAPAPKAATKAVVRRGQKPAAKAVLRVTEAKPRPAKVAKVKAPVRGKPAAARIVKAKAVKPLPKAAKVTLAKAAPKAKPQLAKAGRREKAAWSETPARLEKVRHAERMEPKKPSRLSGLVHALARTAPHRAEPAAKLQKAKLAPKKAKALKPRAQKVAVKARPAKAAPARALAPLRGAGPVRVAKAAPRPDPAVRDADRQMTRAYSTARAAGVPDWQLRRQQARWEATRASAAREAPWAVHDVYLARIAELHDLTRGAQDPGY